MIDSPDSGFPMSRLRRGAELLVDVLRSEGVQHVFGNPGTTELAFIDALAGVVEPSYILGLQEIAVVAMADGYAQASGRVGFVNLHTSGGLGHAIGAILNAQMANTPMVITAGQQDTRHAARDPLLYGDAVAIARPVVKWSREVASPEQLPLLMRRAFNDSQAAPAGPVFLSLPIDVMEATTAIDPGKPSRIERRSVAGSLVELADALARFAPGKLALVVGEEVFASNAGETAADLADLLGAPVFGSSWPGHIPFPTAHPQWRGPLPTQAAAINARLTAYDAVFVLGGQSFITYLYTEGSPLPAHCALFQLSIDPGQPGRTDASTLACVGDIQASLQALLPLLATRLSHQRDAIAAIRAQAISERDDTRAELARRLKAEAGAAVTSPFVAAAEVARAIGPDIAIVDEAPATMTHFRSFLHSPSSRQYVFTRSAILGWGMPAAIGTSLGLGREPVVALIGDGSAMYSPQALWTAAREKLPVTFVVMNNREYNILKNFMRGQAHYRSPGENRFIGMELFDPSIDFVALARSMGLSARRVERAGDIAAAVEAGIASGLPNLIEVVISAA